jgi:hypothetical protein
MNSRSFLALLSLLLISAVPSRAADALRLLFVGNSITLHGPSEKIGWSGNWGMAATALEKDYVHLVVAGVSKQNGAAPEYRVVNVADYERAYAKAEVPAKLTEALAFEPNTAVLAIGENIPALKTEEEKAACKESVTKLMKAMSRDGKTKLIVRSCFWANAAKDAVLKEACATVGGTFLDISALSKDESNYARSERKIENAGVANHPGDKGMQAIADAILSGLPAAR